LLRRERAAPVEGCRIRWNENTRCGICKRGAAFALLETSMARKSFARKTQRTIVGAAKSSAARIQKIAIGAATAAATAAAEAAVEAVLQSMRGEAKAERPTTAVKKPVRRLKRRPVRKASRKKRR